MKKAYIIKLQDGKEITLQFTTWTFSRFCEKNGNLSFTALVDLIGSGNLTAKQIMSLLLCGVEYHCLRNNQPFQYTELDASDWIDDMGGLWSKELQDILLLAITALSNKIEETGALEGEKKETASP